jgi:plastocyanin
LSTVALTPERRGKTGAPVPLREKSWNVHPYRYVSRIVLLHNNLSISRFAHIALLAIASVAVSGCSGLTPPAKPPAAALNSNLAAAANSVVTIVDAKYQPKTLRTKVGTSVKFLNKDDEAHTVTADDNSYSSSFMTPNHAYKHTFSKPGKYKYHCKLHPYMTGTVIVTK